MGVNKLKRDKIFNLTQIISWIFNKNFKCSVFKNSQAYKL